MAPSIRPEGREVCRTATAVILVRVEGEGQYAASVAAAGDPEDDAVAVLDLEGPGLARRAVSDRDAEGAAAERMEGIDDGDGRR